MRKSQIVLASKIRPIAQKMLKAKFDALFKTRVLTDSHYERTKHHWKEGLSRKGWEKIQLMMQHYKFETSRYRCRINIDVYELYKMFFKVEDERYLYQFTEREVVLEKALDALDSYLSKYGYYVCTRPDEVNSTGNMAVTIEPNYGKPAKLPRYVYHVSSAWQKGRILNKGLVPSKGSKESYLYPPKVFVAAKYDEQYLFDLWTAISNYYTGIEDMYHNGGIQEPMVIFKIDTTKLNKGTRFYPDADAKNALWTYTHIPPAALSVKYCDPVGD
jgi:hypothetical protein